MTRRTGNPLVLLLLALPLLLGSCDGKVVYADSAAITDEIWSLSNEVEFGFDNGDTKAKTDVKFLIRTGSDYPYRNIFLFVSSTSPDGTTITDTLEYFLADEKGNSFGKGAGDIHERELPYKSNVFFPLQGRYTFKVRHGMRSMDLPGVYDFGLKIVKTEK